MGGKNVLIVFALLVGGIVFLGFKGGADYNQDGWTDQVGPLVQARVSNYDGYDDDHYEYIIPMAPVPDTQPATRAPGSAYGPPMDFGQLAMRVFQSVPGWYWLIGVPVLGYALGIGRRR